MDLDVFRRALGGAGLAAVDAEVMFLKGQAMIAEIEARRDAHAAAKAADRARGFEAYERANRARGSQQEPLRVAASAGWAWMSPGPVRVW